MPDNTRDNTLIDAQQGNPILLQTNLNTQQLTYDASTTSFLTSTNVPVQDLVSLSDTIIFTNQFDQVSASNSNSIQNFFQINKTSGQITVSVTSLIDTNKPIDPAAYVVANLTARDALAHIPTGTAVLVEDTGQGENAFYIWNGTSYITISTQDSAATNAKTYIATINYNSSNPIIIGRVGAISEIVTAVITVITPFNGTSPTLSVGDATNGNNVIMNSSLNDLTIADKYSSIDSYYYNGTSEITVNAYLNSSGSTVGHAIIAVTYV